MSRHHPLRRIVLLCALLLAGLAAHARAGLEQEISTLEGSGVRIRVTGPLTDGAPGGAFPCFVTVQNRSGAAHTWNFRLEARAGFEHNDHIAASQSLRVEKDSSGTVALFVPLFVPPSGGGTYYQNVSLYADGYGVETREVSIANAGMTTSSSGTAFVAMGDTLATPIWASLEKKYRDDLHRHLNGSTLDSRLLPTDWRGLAGIGCMWLTDGEYTALSADQRVALRRWVDGGGTLLLSARVLDPSLRAGLGLPDNGDEGHPGYGFVRCLPWDGKQLPLDETVRLIDGVHPIRDESSGQNTKDWGMTKSIGIIPLNAAFLLPFIAVFAVLAGPINLFVFAPATRRHRLFWTTPLISCAGSLLLLVVIVLQDGFGGTGERVMVTRLFPAQRQAVVTQEQVIRTGVLLSRHFRMTEDVLLTPLDTHANTGRGFEVAGRDYDGDWFVSRLLQAHRAEAVLPSRAEVQLLNAAEAETGAPPVVVSSIPATLREIYYRDAKGMFWRGSNLHTGERFTLHKQADIGPSKVPDSLENEKHDISKLLPVLPGLPIETGSNLLRLMQTDALQLPGNFLAVADGGPFIETISSVRWKKQQAVYLGPVTPVR